MPNEREAVEVVFMGRKLNDKRILLPPKFTRSDVDTEDFEVASNSSTTSVLYEKHYVAKEQSHCRGKCWFYFILVGALVSSGIGVTIVLVQNRSGNVSPVVSSASSSTSTKPTGPKPTSITVSNPTDSPSSPLPIPKPSEPSTTSTTSPSVVPNPETSLPQTPNPSDSSVPQPTPVPTPNPTASPVAPFTPLFPISRPVAPPAVTSGVDYTNILLTADTRISRNEVLYSPNGQFSIFLTSDNGDLVLMDNTNNIVVWRANAGGGAQTCNLQPDGNMLLRRSDGSVTWSTHTSDNPGASLRLDDGGQLSLMVEDGIPIWLAGIPRGQYNNDTTTTTHTSLTFPIRGAFYYPWFPETWSVNGSPVRFRPRLGYYSNGESSTQEAHVDMLHYAHVKMAIASWWGPDSHLDRSRITNLLNKSRGKSLFWTIYHEVERDFDPSVQEIQADLAYLKKWFAWHENWAHIDGLPVLFLYNEGDCNVSERWMSAAQGEWFVVLKLFRDYENCAVQPSQWHQYGPAGPIAHQPGYSFSISPGFWRADLAEPQLARVSKEDFYSSVVSMVNSSEPWQLITTFNEWGEGTAVEPAAEWASSSGYGYYLDSLHDVY